MPKVNETQATAGTEELNPFVIAQKQFETAAEYLKLDQWMREILVHGSDLDAARSLLADNELDAPDSPTTT